MATVRRVCQQRDSKLSKNKLKQNKTSLRPALVPCICGTSDGIVSHQQLFPESGSVPRMRAELSLAEELRECRSSLAGPQSCWTVESCGDSDGPGDADSGRPAEGGGQEDGTDVSPTDWIGQETDGGQLRRVGTHGSRLSRRRLDTAGSQKPESGLSA